MKFIRALALTLLASCALAQNAALMPMPKLQFFDANGAPLAGGLIYSYAAGTTTPLATYTDSSAGTPNANPVVLDAGGRASIWIGANAYKIVAQNYAGVQQWSVDNIVSTSAFASLGSLSGSNGATLVGYTASGAGAVTRTVAAKLGDVVSVRDFGAKGDGVTDDTAAIAAAINYVKGSVGYAQGGSIYFPRGIYITSSTIVLDGVENITLYGDGGFGFATGSNAPSTIDYSGTGTIISARGSGSLVMRDMGIRARNASYAGTMLDLSGGSSGSLVSRVRFVSVLPGAAYDINLDGMIEAQVEQCLFEGYRVAIQGIGSGLGFSNDVSIRDNTFGVSTQGGTIASIKDPGSGWVIQGNTDELSYPTANTKQFISCSAIPLNTHGVDVSGNFPEDALTGYTGTIITVCGSGWNIHGNALVGISGSTGIDIAPGSSAVSIQGNFLANLTNGIKLEAGTSSVSIGSNYFQTVTTEISGAPGFGTVDNTSASSTTMYGLVSIPRALTLSGSGAQTLLQGTSLTSDQAYGGIGTAVLQGRPSSAGPALTAVADGVGRGIAVVTNNFSSAGNTGSATQYGPTGQVSVTSGTSALGTYTFSNPVSVTGTTTSSSGFVSGSSAGGTQVVNVRNSTSGGACTITYVGGLFVSTTCP